MRLLAVSKLEDAGGNVSFRAPARARSPAPTTKTGPAGTANGILLVDDLACRASGAGPRLPASELISGRDGWWRWDGIPDNEKYFFYHVLNRSLVPCSFLELHNAHVPADKRVSFLGRANGLLMPERHHPNCTCVCAL